MLSEFITAFFSEGVGQGREIISERLYSGARDESGKCSSCPCESEAIFYFHGVWGLNFLGFGSVLSQICSVR